jgi:hypothetical protein
MKLFLSKSAFRIVGMTAILSTGLAQAATLTSLSVTPSFAAGTDQHQVYISSDPKWTAYDFKGGKNAVVFTVLGTYSDASVVDLSSIASWRTDCLSPVAVGEIQYGRYVVKAIPFAKGTCSIKASYSGQTGEAKLHVALVEGTTARDPGVFKTLTILPAVSASSPFTFNTTIFTDGSMALEAFGNAENGSIWPLSLEKKSSAPPLPGSIPGLTYSLDWQSTRLTVARMSSVLADYYRIPLGSVIPLSSGTTQVSVSAIRDGDVDEPKSLTAQSEFTVRNSLPGLPPTLAVLSGLPAGLNALLFTAGYICNDVACTGCPDTDPDTLAPNKSCLGKLGGKDEVKANRIDGDVVSFGDVLYAPLAQHYFGQYYPSNRSNFAVGLWTMAGTVYEGLGKLACSPDHQLPAKLPSGDIKTLKPGVYCTQGDLTIDEGLSLEINQDGTNKPLIIQVNGNLVVNQSVSLSTDYVSKAVAANQVYWIVKYDRKTRIGGTQVEIKGLEGTRFYGNIVTQANFTLSKKNVLCGRFFTFGQGARVTLKDNTVITLSDPKYC